MKRRERLIAGFYGAVVGLIFGLWLAVPLLLVVQPVLRPCLTVTATMALAALYGFGVGGLFGLEAVEIGTLVATGLPW
jgi:uncharacterized protein YacL